MHMKGIILAGGSGTRLYPLTRVISKQLLPVYDKPMIYYPLATLMQAEIRDILIISTPEDCARFQKLLGDGRQFGIQLSYAVQPEPAGIVQALLIGREFVGNNLCAVALGDNIFYGAGFLKNLRKAVKSVEKGYAAIFGYAVTDPERYGVVELDENGRILSVEEKPQIPKSEYCITGLYFFDKNVVKMAEKVVASERGELEMTDLLRLYLEDNCLTVQVLNEESVWFDTGTIESLMEASIFVQETQKKLGKAILSPEDIAYARHWIEKEERNL